MKRNKGLQVIKVSNLLCRANLKTENVYEWRILAAIISQIQQGENEFKEIDVPFSKCMGTKVHGGRDYSDLKTAFYNIISRTITIEENNGKERIIPLFEHGQLLENKNGDKTIIRGKLHNQLMPYLLNLKKDYVEYPLDEFLSLSSVYSQKIYNLLKSLGDCSAKKERVEKLHNILGITESARNNFAEFKRRTLEPAKEEINKVTSLKFEYEIEKEGRKVSIVTFKFIKKRIKQTENNDEDKEFVELLEQVGDEKLRAKLIEKYNRSVNKIADKKANKKNKEIS